MMAATPAELAAGAVPLAGGRFSVGYRGAIICDDGAIWVFWTQDRSVAYEGEGGSRVTREQWANSPELGLHCRLVSREGLDIVPPLRILPLAFGEQGWVVPLVPGSFTPMVTDDGSVIVFVENPLALPQELTSIGPGPARTTTVITVDRQGNANRTVLSDRAKYSHVGFNRRPTASFWWWRDSSETLRCILGTTTGRASYSTFSAQGDAGWRVSQDFYFATGGLVDSAFFAGDMGAYLGGAAVTPVSYRRGLVWTFNSRDYSGVCRVGPDTLLVAYMPPAGERDAVWGSRWPGENLVVYRLLEHDLSLVDSTSVSAGLVEGTDFTGARIPMGVLQKSSSGFDFFVARPKGVAMYRLDLDGKPLQGKRAPSSVSASAEISGVETQLISFVGPSYTGPSGWQTEWFGFTRSGGLRRVEAIRNGR